jgi:hypothetical protein
MRGRQQTRVAVRQRTPPHTTTPRRAISLHRVGVKTRAVSAAIGRNG